MTPSKIPAAGGRRRAILLASIIVVALFAMGACADSKPRRTTSTPSGPDVTLGRKSLDEDTVLRLVRQQVARNGGSVTVQVPYWETSKRKVTCYGDPQFEGCYADQFSPTGFSKDIRTQERLCCRSKQRSIPSQASWKAIYQTTSDEWDVKVEFSLDDVKQLIAWTVDDDTQEVGQSR